MAPNGESHPCLFHRRAQILDIGIGIEPRGDGDVAMPEDLLHQFQIAGLAQRAHAGGVAQVVDARRHAGLGPAALWRHPNCRLWPTIPEPEQQVVPKPSASGSCA
jgi:hypothetical protein